MQEVSGMTTKTNIEYYFGFLKSVFDRVYLTTIAVGVIVGLAVFLYSGEVVASSRWAGLVVAIISGLDYILRLSDPEKKSEYNNVLIFVARVSLACVVAISV
ncbi:MAG: hypothetical protein DI546_03345 [Rhizobium sp.]|nr:MAG: hypothetical protein DI546_03345 [Rhizobium sp.]